MNGTLAPLAGAGYLVSELGLAIAKRAKADQARVEDKGSLRLLWTVIGMSVAAAYLIASRLPALALVPAGRFAAAGIGVFAAGLLLRWYAILHLGRFFTVNVAIAADHRLIDSGPYRFVRHPSYAGALLAFAGLGLCMGNGASVAVVVLPTFLVFLRRMRIEEDALTRALGQAYSHYRRRTKRLIPAVY